METSGTGQPVSGKGRPSTLYNVRDYFLSFWNVGLPKLSSLASVFQRKYLWDTSIHFSWKHADLIDAFLLKLISLKVAEN